MHRALTALGQRCPPQSEVIIAGGAAAILCQWLSRTTDDIDVIDAEPRLAQLQIAVVQVADELQLSERWLNDGAKGFAAVLPPDFRERLVEVGQFGQLTVHAIARRDFILLKLYAFRPIDFEDLRLLRPNAEELEFVQEQLPRIATFDAKKAYYIELYLRQGDSPSTGETHERD